MGDDFNDKGPMTTDYRQLLTFATMYSSQRLSSIAPTIFAEISALAREFDAVNLGQGFPDFDGPPEIIEAARRAMVDGRNQYAISSGEPPLRRAIAEHSQRFHGMEIDPDRQVTVTSGATEAIFSALLAFIDPGDEVIVMEPYYDSYVPDITFAGGIPVPVTLRPPDFDLDLDAFRGAITPRTKAIILNTPHNPIGKVFTLTEMLGIAELCIEHNLLAIVDEVYEHIVYAPARHIRMATLPGMSERTVTISSGGKSFSFTGWKIGWAIASPTLTESMRKIHQYVTFATATPFQHAIATALQLDDDYFQKLADEYRERRDHLFATLANTLLTPFLPDGSYFILCDISKYPDTNSIDFVRRLIREHGVAAIPTQTFYLDPSRGDSLVRFCFCKRHETLELGRARMLGE